MKASELIEELQKQLDEHGDRDVVIYADHGHSQMTCDGIGLVSCEENPDKPDVIELYGDVYYE